MGRVETTAQPGLLALFQEWIHAATGHLGHQKFHGVGANIDHGAAL